MNELDRIISAARASMSSGEPSAIATILTTEGSSFRRAGTRLWLGAEQRVGAISGGCLESDLAERARAVRSAGPRLIAYDSSADGDVLWGTASGCGGILRILLEPLTPSLLADLEWIQEELEGRRPAALVTRWDGSNATRRRYSGEPSRQDTSETLLASRALRLRRNVTASEGGSLLLAEAHLPPVALTLFGSGADARSTSRLATSLGWRVLLLSDAPSADQALARGEVLVDARSAVLLMTHNFHRDAELLARLSRTEAGYIGVLGPRRRTIDLLAQGDPAARETPALHAPPGLDIGGETPEEIALSLLGEIQAHFAGREGGRLRERSAPIHDREPSLEMEPLLTTERKP